MKNKQLISLLLLAAILTGAVSCGGSTPDDTTAPEEAAVTDAVYARNNRLEEGLGIKLEHIAVAGGWSERTGSSSTSSPPLSCPVMLHSRWCWATCTTCPH